MATAPSTEITSEIKAKLEVDTRDLVARAEAMEIKTEQTNTEAAKFTAMLKGEIKNRKAILAPTKAALDASKSAYNGLVEMMIDPLDDCVKIISVKIGDFLKAEDIRRAELQRKEDERVAKLQRREDERIARLTAKAEEAGKPTPVITPKIIPQRTVAAVSAPSGTTYTTRWSAQVVDIKALCRAVADGVVPEHFVTAVMPPLNALAVARKSEGEIVPGVVAMSQKGISQRTAVA